MVYSISLLGLLVVFAAIKMAYENGRNDGFEAGYKIGYSNGYLNAAKEKAEKTYENVKKLYDSLQKSEEIESEAN